MFKRPLRCILRVQGYHHLSYVMVWSEMCHQRETYSFLQEKDETCLRVYQEVQQGVVNQLNMALSSVKEMVFQ